jgi:hypothetical protein
MNMTTRPPLAAVYCYLLAGLFTLFGVIVIAAGVFDAVNALIPGLPREYASFMRAQLVFVGFVQLLGAAGFVAMGAVIHDIRRIAENTASIVSNQTIGALSPPRQGFAGLKSEAVFFYFEKDVEHGPVSKIELAALIGSGRVNPFQRIEKSVGGIRQPFEKRDLE